MCCIISGDPIDDPSGRIKTFGGPNRFQTNMLNAPCAGGCGTCCWCMGQFIPITGGCTQYLLRRKVLNYDMTKYSCFQGKFSFCCGAVEADACGERNCPDFCAFLEGCCCNCLAVSASRIYVMEKYDLQSDPCDYRLIRINNFLQMLSCLCDILALFNGNFRQIARIVDHIADLFYHTISGCMTAQTSFEVDYQNSLLAGGNFQANGYTQSPAAVAVAVPSDYSKY
mmetsp:Transcript_39063/g.28883  ORF Transcript_39063/g.28883 Transcript_39063/m.28883 type:complete len:226 (+) Transcript_39063:53-730(+)